MISDALKEISTHYPNIEWEGKTWNDVGPGWVSLVDRTMKKLSNMAGPENPILIFQVKEKFGVLTIYASFKTENKVLQPSLDKIIREAREESQTICEYCGKPGFLRDSSKGPLLTVCDECEKDAREAWGTDWVS